MVKTIIRQASLTPFTQYALPRSHALEPFLRLVPLPDLVIVSISISILVNSCSTWKTNLSGIQWLSGGKPGIIR